MEVRDGVLRYPDGKEVALWGVAYYPQSFTQYFSLERLGVDRRRSTDEDLDDFVEMGIGMIISMGSTIWWRNAIGRAST
jgi:hypothetical protein